MGLFNKLSTDPDTRERFPKLLIKGLLGIEIDEIITHTEKMILPNNPDKRGVRLDLQIDNLNKGIIKEVYDIEPHREEEANYPKYSRYRQALLDKDSIASGDNNFGKLPELFIINITNYDPFGMNYMLYTFKTRCNEIPELCYNDGVTIYYFNTQGELGGTEALKNFLNYLETSNEENIADEVTKELNGYVDIIKHKSGGEYMTLGDWVDKIADGVAKEAVKEVIKEKDEIIDKKNMELAEQAARIKELEEQLALKS